jgi:DNA-binding Xre family transcriptional regulator
MANKNKHRGSDFRDFLKQEGILEECEAAALKLVIATQLKGIMEEHSTSQSELARRMNTSRTAVSRLLDPANTSVTLQTLEKAAHAVNCRLKLELEPLGKAFAHH